MPHFEPRSSESEGSPLSPPQTLQNKSTLFSTEAAAVPIKRMQFIAQAFGATPKTASKGETSSVMDLSNSAALKICQSLVNLENNSTCFALFVSLPVQREISTCRCLAGFHSHIHFIANKMINLNWNETYLIYFFFFFCKR